MNRKDVIHLIQIFLFFNIPNEKYWFRMQHIFVYVWTKSSKYISLIY